MTPISDRESLTLTTSYQQTSPDNDPHVVRWTRLDLVRPPSDFRLFCHLPNPNKNSDAGPTLDRSVTAVIVDFLHVPAFLSCQ